MKINKKNSLKLFLFISLSLLNVPSYANKDILVIHSWHDILWDRLWEKGLNQKLGGNYNLIRRDLDAMRLNPKELSKKTEEIWNTFLELKPDLVVLGDDIALKQYGERLKGEIPVVYLGINHNARIFFNRGIIPKNITGILERPLYQRAVHQIVDILPNDSKKIMILNDSPIEEGSVTDINKLFANTNYVRVEDIDIELRIATTWESWQQTVLNAKDDGYDAILFDSRYLLRDAQNRYVEPESGVVKWMAKNSPVPIFNFYEDSIGPKLSTGGWVVSGIKIGQLAGDYINRIMNGEKPETIVPYTFSEGEYIFSKTQLDYWGIKLPLYLINKVKYVEDMHDLYEFNCNNYPNSICYD